MIKIFFLIFGLIAYYTDFALITALFFGMAFILCFKQFLLTFIDVIGEIE